jgi:hypothetical protein
MHTNSNSQNQKRAIYWQNQIRDWKASGLSQKQFCRRQALALSTFSYWKRKLEKFAEPTPVEFYPLTISTQDPDQNSPALLLQVCQKRFAVEIKENFSQATLVELIATLERL